MRDIGNQVAAQLVYLAQLVRRIIQRISQLIDLTEIAAFKVNIIMAFASSLAECFICTIGRDSFVEINSEMTIDKNNVIKANAKN